MPNVEILTRQTVTTNIQLVVDLQFPPVENADETIRYGHIGHIELKGVDDEGNTAGRIVIGHDETPDSVRYALVAVLLAHAGTIGALCGTTIDLTPVQYEE